MYDNQGNIAVKPDIQLTIKKGENTVFNAIFPYSESQEAVRAYSIKEVSPIEWQTAGQGNGKYTAELKVTLNGEVVAEDDFRFSIGYFQGSMWVSAISFLGGGSLGLGWVILAVILLVIIGALGFLSKRGLGFARTFRV
ncbi:MAG: hypothetical protein Q8Q48_01455 [Candidatus Staskawiczbacteria bacterium]|nr:hypothetical protein [Candidatus Staskawiczbacteria bacterium]